VALGVFDSLGYYGDNPSVVEVATGIYAIAHCMGMTPDGYIRTVSIDTAGNVESIQSWEFETTQGRSPSIVHVTGDIYAVAYEDVSGSGQLITVEIDSAGNITVPRLDILEFYTYTIGTRDYLEAHLIHLSGDKFVIAYADANQLGWLATVGIDAAGNITAIDSYRYEASYARYPYIEKIFGTVYAIAYGEAAKLKTLTIADNGTIAPTPEIDYLRFEPGYSSSPCIAHVAGDIYAIAYRGPGSDGWLATVDIDSAGNIEDTIVDSYEFDESYGGEPYIIKLTSGLFAIAYRGVGDDGFVITIAIADNGTIGAISETLEYDPSRGDWPFVVEVTADIFAIACHGYLRTIGVVEAPTATTDPATSREKTAATLNGTLDDDGGPACNCGFEWGETTAYGNTTATESKETGQTFSQGISGLTPGMTYHFRAFATNGAGTSYGADRTFTTLVAAATVTTDPATGLAAVLATLNGTLNDDGGEACDCGFEWGLDTDYGVTTPTESKTAVNTFSQVIGGLFPNTTYHFRALATNSAGTGHGDDRTFTTALVISRAYALSRHEL